MLLPSPRHWRNSESTAMHAEAFIHQQFPAPISVPHSTPAPPMDLDQHLTSRQRFNNLRSGHSPRPQHRGPPRLSNAFNLSPSRPTYGPNNSLRFSRSPGPRPNFRPSSNSSAPRTYSNNSNNGNYNSRPFCAHHNSHSHWTHEYQYLPRNPPSSSAPGRGRPFCRCPPGNCRGGRAW